MGDAAAFLAALWPLDVPDDSQLVISTMRPGEGIRNHAAASVDNALAHAQREVRGAHVWLNVAARKLCAEGRGRTEDLTWIPALWADLDVAEGAPEGVHRGGATFATYDDAGRFLESFVIPPSLIVRTGYGLSAWWILGEPEEATAAAPVLAALKATVMRLSGGRTDPAVYDTARMMRLPGTWNVKVPSNPRLCQLTSWDTGARYSLADLAERLDLPPAPPVHEAAPVAPRTGGAGRPGDDFDEQATTDSVVALLVAHGAQVHHEATIDGRKVVYLTHPEKHVRQGHSMTVGYVGPAITHMFSSSWEKLPPDTYRPYRLYAHLEHDGDTLTAVRALAAQGYGHQLVPLAKLPELNDTAIARDCHAWLDDTALYVEGAGWHLWDGRRFVADPERHALTVRVMEYADALVARAKLDAEKATDPKKGAAMLGLARTWHGRASQVRLMENLAALAGVPADEMDADWHLLNARNGIVDLRTGELAPHDPAYRMTKVAHADYDPQAASEDWSKALGALPGDAVEWLQVAAGLTAVGRAAVDTIFVAHGEGGNGKSTILGAIQAALGDYAVEVVSKLFTGDGAENQLKMPLRGARMAVAYETGQDHYLNMERLKSVTGGDAITDRHLYSRSWATWRPTHNLWLSTNHRPRVRDTDIGTWRRLKLVPFGQTYAEGSRTIDLTLRDRLKDDAANRAAVLAWIVAGAKRWEEEGRLPDSIEVERVTTEWRDEEDAMASFLADRYAVTGDPADYERSKPLYEAYRDHCDGNGLRPLNQRNFTNELERHARRLAAEGRPTLKHGRDKHGKFWRGLRALTSPTFGFQPPPPPALEESPGEVPW